MPTSFDKSTHAYSLLFQGDGVWPMAVALLDGGNKVAAADRSGAIYLWDLASKPADADEKEKKKDNAASDLAPKRRLVGHANAVTKLIALPDGRTLISASIDRTIRFWDTQAEPSGVQESILDIEDRKQEARRNKEALDKPGIDVLTISPTHALEGHQEWINAMALSRDGKRLITGDDAAHVIVWDIAAKKPIAQWDGRPGGWVAALALDEHGKQAFVGEYSTSRGDFDRPPPEVRVYDVEQAKVKTDILAIQTPDVKERDNSYGYYSKWSKFVKRGIVCAAFSPDGKTVALGQGGETDKGQAHLVEVETGKVIRTISGHQYGMTDLLFDAEGKHLITAGRDTVVRVTKVADGKEVAALGKPRGGQFKDWITAISLSPDQRTLAGADMGGLVQVWKFG